MSAARVKTRRAKRKDGSVGKIPEGTTFLRLIADLEERCQSLTKKHIPKLGVRLPELVAAVGTALSLLDRAASCWWGCKGGDHRGEFLIGRCAVSSHAALKLLRSGYYDEALSVIRSLAEVANLLALFAVDRSKFAEWKISPDSSRQKKFSAVKVRLALEEGGHFIPIDKDRYAALSAYAVHAGPSNVPQAHNMQGTPVAFPKYEEAGVFLCVNELGLSLAVIVLLTPSVVELPSQFERGLVRYPKRSSRMSEA
jgi:hypothetical protein